MTGKLLARSVRTSTRVLHKHSKLPSPHTRPRCLSTTAAASPAPRQDDAPRPGMSSRRIDALKEAKPFSDFLTDNFNRHHDYLRISVTERCNLRCVYCMPEEGVPLSPQRELLTTPEIVMLSSVFVDQGVTKIRLTGGEPTVRRDIVPLMHQLGALRPRGLRELCLTTNGIALHRKLEAMVEAGLTGINLSLDTLDPWQFQIMTRRNGFDAVLKSIARIQELNRAGAGVRLKINCVVMRGRNDREILKFVEMTREQDIEVRFIEYMPFDGNKWNEGKMLGYAEMLDIIRVEHPGVEPVRGHRNDTSKTWRVPGFVGRLGFITSMTHNFCGTCNRLRITGDGNIKVCLFGNAEVSLRDILRRSNGGEPIDEQAYEAMRQIDMDRRQGLAGPGQPPLGTVLNEAELLDVIRLAVKGKNEKHAGMGELKNMKNRPMILIGG
ncbi:molybdenum cofactor biosynthesis protein A [Plectosphaerella cucumerina]|uniref:GTP 3',8-cyclase n=1 Tax=Plectosphaerella cucumerina TaxID=40658 RepID=A0A8K0T9N4_9PEZI|nr:molybdenum cofactor biosynthesis protein A [Plectosphaerella cucumerina]